jgi:ABC-2 type transport system permease protein
VHRQYNPEGLSRYNIVPGLDWHDFDDDHGDAHRPWAMTRERERGTMENLLATPVRPV